MITTWFRAPFCRVANCHAQNKNLLSPPRFQTFIIGVISVGPTPVKPIPFIFSNKPPPPQLTLTGDQSITTSIPTGIPQKSNNPPPAIFMNPPQSPPQSQPEPNRPVPVIPPLSPIHHSHSSSSSPRFPPPTPVSGAQRRIAIAVDLSDESAHAVKWAVQNYLRPGDAVILLHVRPTSILYGADWGAIDPTAVPSPDAVSTVEEQAQQKLEDDFDNFTTNKATNVAQPLVEAGIPFKIHIVKDHDMKERLCLEVERLGLSAVIMGSRGFGALKRQGKGRLGSVSDYCVHHCVCPVVVVRYPDENDGDGDGKAASGGKSKVALGDEAELHPVPEEEQEYHDADDK